MIKSLPTPFFRNTARNDQHEVWINKPLGLTLAARTCTKIIDFHAELIFLDYRSEVHLDIWACQVSLNRFCDVFHPHLLIQDMTQGCIVCILQWINE
jgi:hypothetical protein